MLASSTGSGGSDTPHRYVRGCPPQRCLAIRGSRVDPRLAPARIPRAAAALRSLRTATRRFLVAERGSVAIESALALTVLVSAFAGLMNIVGDVWADDRMARGARAAARAIALNPSIDPWAAIEREGVLDANAACPGWTATANTCGGWTLRIDRGVAPAALPNDLAANVSSASGGQLVLVRLDHGGSVALGLARSEPRA